MLTVIGLRSGMMMSLYSCQSACAVERRRLPTSCEMVPSPARNIAIANPESCQAAAMATGIMRHRHAEFGLHHVRRREDRGDRAVELPDDPRVGDPARLERTDSRVPSASLIPVAEEQS